MREPSAYHLKDEEFIVDPLDQVHVHGRFSEAVSSLGEESKNTWGFFQTITPKNNKATRERCNAIAEGVVKKLTRKLWRRKSQYHQLRSIRAIETKNMRDHVHGITLVDIDDLKQTQSQQGISKMIEEIAYSFHEVNDRHKDKDRQPVMVEPFIYFDDPSNRASGDQAGTYIKYICKTATHTNNPLA